EDGVARREVSRSESLDVLRGDGTDAVRLSRRRPMVGVFLRKELPVEVLESGGPEPVLRPLAKLFEQDSALDLQCLAVLWLQRAGHPFRFHSEHRRELATGENRRKAEPVGHRNGLRRATGALDSLREAAAGSAPRSLEGEMLAEVGQAGPGSRVSSR